MIRIFNAFQIITFFAALPFLIGWLYTEPFTYSVAAFWTAIVVYVVTFGMLVGVLSDALYKR